METNNSLDIIIEKLSQGQLAQAIVDMEAYNAAWPQRSCEPQLQSVKSDFEMMSGYWKRGYKDPQLPSLYQKLLRQMYELTANLQLNYIVGHSSYYSTIYMRKHLSARDWSLQLVKDEMEDFVSNLAMVDLEPENKQKEKRKELYASHIQLLIELFGYVMTSPIWGEGNAQAMEEILLSPTIDSDDQQTLVSAISLATFNIFDMAKFRTLINVYRQATDEYVRQRALVGWVMALEDFKLARIFPEVKQQVDKLLEDERCCLELKELQEQIGYCLQTDEADRTMRQEIMRDLMQNPELKFFRNGIVDTDEDTLEDILHSDEQERKLQKAEDSIRRMIEMQKQGKDIFYGSFSQTKRDPFFQEVANWLIPFNLYHPGLTDAYNYSDNKLLKILLDTNPLCDSDKYSFTLNFGKVFRLIPDDLKNMVDREGIVNLENIGFDTHSPSFIRRNYLQNLYRLMRLYARSNELRLPLVIPDAIFCANPFYRSTHLERYFTDVAAFLVKNNMPEEAYAVLQNCGEPRRDFKYYMLSGYLCQHYHYGDDLECYQKAVDLQPESEKAHAGLAKALFEQECFEESLAEYEQLAEAHPDKRIYRLNRAVCLIKVGRYTEAEKTLYKLNFEDESDNNVSRVLAWALTCNSKYEPAIRLYNQLLATRKQPDDMLNYGYCLWLSGQIDDAADCFHSYLSATGKDKETLLEDEADLLREHGITEAEQQMMLFLL